MAKSMIVSDAVPELLRKVPAFALARESNGSYISHGDDGSPYLVFGDFARFLTDLTARDSSAPQSAMVLASTFDFLNHMANSSDQELINLLVVGVFEPLSDSPKSVEIARALLSDQALALFERVLRGWTG